MGTQVQFIEVSLLRSQFDLEVLPASLNTAADQLAALSAKLWEIARRVDEAANGLDPADEHGLVTAGAGLIVAWQGPTATAYQGHRKALTGDKFGLIAVADCADLLAEEVRRVAGGLGYVQDDLDKNVTDLKAASLQTYDRAVDGVAALMLQYRSENDSFVNGILGQMESHRSRARLILEGARDEMDSLRQRGGRIDEFWGFVNFTRKHPAPSPKPAELWPSYDLIRITPRLLARYNDNIVTNARDRLAEATSAFLKFPKASYFGNLAMGSGVDVAARGVWSAIVKAVDTLSKTFETDRTLIQDYLVAHDGRGSRLARQGNQPTSEPVPPRRGSFELR